MTKKNNRLDNEENLKNNILIPCIKELGFNEGDILYEKSFSIKLGKKDHEITRGRADVLCKVNDENLFVIETKADSLKITEDDIKQAISYARLLDQIAPFTIVTNGRDTKIFDSITKKELTLKTIIESEYVKNGLTIALDIEARYEALEYFIGYSKENVKVFSKIQIDSELDKLKGDLENLSKKYIPDLFIDRKKVEEEFNNFLQSKENVFLLFGESGVGKTNFLCNLIEKISTDKITFFYNGSFLNKALFMKLKEEFNCFFSPTSTEIEIIKKLNALARKTKENVYIFIDAIDEIPSKERVLEIEELCKSISQFKNIKLILSCKTGSLETYEKIMGLETLLKKCPRIEMKKFDDSELELIIPKYMSAYSLKGTFSKNLKEEFALGFYLKVLAEVYEGKKLPEALDTVSVFKQFILKKATNAGLEVNEVIKILNLVGKGLVEGNNKYITLIKEDDLSVIIDEKFFEYNLLEKEIIDLKTYIGFYDSKILDFIVAIYSYELDEIGMEDLENVAKKLKNSIVGLSSLVWYGDYISKERKEVFFKIKREEALTFVTKYEEILDKFFLEIKYKFEPYTMGKIGISIDNKATTAVGSYSFHELQEGDEKVSTFNVFGESLYTSSKKVWHSGPNLRYLHKYVQFYQNENVLVNAAETIYKQLEKIIEKKELNEEININFSVEKLLNLVYYADEGNEYKRSSRHSYFPSYKSILPLNLKDLKEQIINLDLDELKKYLNAKKYFEHLQIEELFSDGTGCYSFEPELLNYDVIERNAKNAIKNNKKIPEQVIVEEIYPKETILEEVDFLIKNGITEISEELTESSDIPEKNVKSILIKKGLQVNWFSNLYYASFSEGKLQEYIKKLFLIFLSEYKKMVETNFDFCKNEFQYYKNFPLKIKVVVSEKGGLSISYFVKKNTDAKYNEIDVSFNRESSPSFSDYKNDGYFCYSQSGIDHIFIRNFYGKKTNKGDKYCIIKSMVYETILKEYKEIKKNITMYLNQALQHNK